MTEFPDPSTMTQDEILAWLDLHRPTSATVVRNILDIEYQKHRQRIDRLPFATDAEVNSLIKFYDQLHTETARAYLKRIIGWMKNDRSYRLPAPLR